MKHTPSEKRPCSGCGADLNQDQPHDVGCPHKPNYTQSYIAERNKHGDLKSRKRALPRRRKPL